MKTFNLQKFYKSLDSGSYNTVKFVNKDYRIESLYYKDAAIGIHKNILKNENLLKKQIMMQNYKVMTKMFCLIVFCAFISCTSQKNQLFKDGNLDTALFYELKEQENSKYSIKNTFMSVDRECKTIIVKKDSSKIIVCREYKYTAGKRNDSVYNTYRTYISEYDGFRCEFNELNYYNASGQITQSEKYLSRIMDSQYVGLCLPLENTIFQNGKIVETKKNEPLIPLHKILIESILVYQREHIGEQGGEAVGVGNYEFEYKNNKLEIVPKINGTKTKRISRYEILKALNKIKTKFEVSKDFDDDEWIISFGKHENNYIIGINNENGRGHVKLESKRDVEEDILH